MAKTAENPSFSDTGVQVPGNKLAQFYQKDMTLEAQTPRSAADQAMGAVDKRIPGESRELDAGEIRQFAKVVSQFPNDMLQINVALLKMAQANTFKERAKRRSQILSVIKTGQVDMDLPDSVSHNAQRLVRGESDFDKLGSLKVLGEVRIFRDHYYPVLTAVDGVTQEVEGLIPPAEKIRKKMIGTADRVATVFDRAAKDTLDARKKAETEARKRDEGIANFEGQIMNPAFTVTPELKTTIMGLMKSAKQASDARILEAHKEAKARTAAGAILPSLGTVAVGTQAEAVLIELAGSLNIAYNLALACYLSSVYRALMLTSQQMHAQLLPFFQQIKAHEQAMLDEIKKGGQMLNPPGQTQE